MRSEADLEGLESLANHSIELGIKSIDTPLLLEARRIMDRNNTMAASVHAPKLSPDVTENAILTLYDLFSAQRFTIHPDKRNKEQAVRMWAPVLHRLAKKDIRIGFENSRKTGSWLTDPYDIPRKHPFYITFDMNHLPAQYDEAQVLEDLKDRILITHVVDRKYTAPYENFQKLFPHMLNAFHIEYVLEYGRQHLDTMKQDYKVLTQLSQDCDSQRSSS